MKELIERWRAEEKCMSFMAEKMGVACANELENYLASLWHTITDDPATWPEDGEWIYVCIGFPEGFGQAVLQEWGQADPSEYIGNAYRKAGIPGIDYPEQDNDAT